MRNFFKVAILSGAVALAAASPAPGAMTIGSTTTPTANCSENYTFIQTISPGDSHIVPSAGVITSWTFQAGAVTPQMRFKVVRQTGIDTFRTVGWSDLVTPVPNQLQSFPTRITVAPGDILGFYLATPGNCSGFDDAYSEQYAVGDIPPGEEALYNASDGDRLNIAASLEPDADGDGYGDETQDECPTDAGKQGDCDPPDAAITKGAPNKTEKSKVKFSFESNEAGSTFECKKYRTPWKPCTSPTKMMRLDEGKHKFKVRATDQAGNTGKAAKDKFKVVG